MGTPQTTYTQTPAAAYAGMLADSGQDKFTISRNADAACDAGLFLSDGATTGVTSKLPAAAGDVTTLGLLLGVSMYVDMKMPTGLATRFKQFDTVPILRKGRIWVLCEGAVTAGAFFITRATANFGQIRGDSTNASAAPAGCSVVVGAGAGGLALVEVNLP